MKGRGGSVLAVAILFFILSWLTVSLRVYTRHILLRQFGKDDWAMVATLFLFTIYLACQITAVAHGTGQHIWDLDPRDARTALIFWYLCELLYILSNCTLKIALGIFYLRVAVKKGHILVIKTVMLGTVLFGLCYFFMAAFQCIPVSEFWDHHPALEKCIPEAPTTGITYSLSAVNACADWILGLLPFFIVWDLQVNRKTKIMVAGILAFAAIGSTGTVVRMKYIHTLTHGDDFLWATTDVAIWSTVEPGIGITAASMATLKPLLQLCLYYMGLGAAPQSARLRASEHSSRSGRKRRGQNSYHHSPSLELRPADGSTSTIVSGPQKPESAWQARVEDPEEEEETVGTPTVDGINKSVRVEYTFEGPPRLELRNSLLRGGYSKVFL
ncbi:hypothetical protein BCR34DRAFT_499411 [Clohesyomyces aquaticus]|uniref:Rhodopsin domain-containing protein n=1 Tax=Clohesyomyces aquaticus TaxID=1231657 RepID=A0A1Y1Y858_9PLEO|nr:hypothetical protein BCR34DRAFT_499411 [Clohesyomyces aquaticus]